MSILLIISDFHHRHQHSSVLNQQSKIPNSQLTLYNLFNHQSSISNQQSKLL